MSGCRCRPFYPLHLGRYRPFYPLSLDSPDGFTVTWSQRHEQALNYVWPGSWMGQNAPVQGTMVFTTPTTTNSCQALSQTPPLVQASACLTRPVRVDAEWRSERGSWKGRKLNITAYYCVGLSGHNIDTGDFVSTCLGCTKYALCWASESFYKTLSQLKKDKVKTQKKAMHADWVGEKCV